jgi:hypothetical protein
MQTFDHMNFHQLEKPHIGPPHSSRGEICEFSSSEHNQEKVFKLAADMIIII